MWRACSLRWQVSVRSSHWDENNEFTEQEEVFSSVLAGSAAKLNQILTFLICWKLSVVCLLWSHNCMIVCTSNLKLTSFFIVITVAKNNSHCYSQKCVCLKFAWSNYQIVKSRVKMSSGPALFSFFFFHCNPWSTCIHGNPEGRQLYQIKGTRGGETGHICCSSQRMKECGRH